MESSRMWPSCVAASIVAALLFLTVSPAQAAVEELVGVLSTGIAKERLDIKKLGIRERREANGATASPSGRQLRLFLEGSPVLLELKGKKLKKLKARLLQEATSELADDRILPWVKEALSAIGLESSGASLSIDFKKAKKNLEVEYKGGRRNPRLVFEIDVPFKLAGAEKKGRGRYRVSAELPVDTACQTGDPDSDGVCNDVDLCPDRYDPDQSDLDGDGLGDSCDPAPQDPFAGPVAPVYAAAGDAWNTHVANDGSGPLDASGTPCDASNPNGTAASCLHAGELRRVELVTSRSCAELQVSDELDLFEWSCTPSAQGVVLASTGLKPGLGLRDLIDWVFRAWRAVTGGGKARDRNEPRKGDGIRAN